MKKIYCWPHFIMKQRQTGATQTQSSDSNLQALYASGANPVSRLPAGDGN